MKALYKHMNGAPSTQTIPISTETLPNRRRFICALAACNASAWLSPAIGQADSPPKPLLVLGDSLSAEYGLARGTGWVALLAQRMKQQSMHAPVINASVSGDTTAGGRARLPALLEVHQPSIVIVELGGNDALRGLPLRNTQDNLLAMVAAAQNKGAKVLLLGMQMPPNYGKKYAEDFANIYKQVAQVRQAVLLPFFLKNVADVPDSTNLFQADRIHPNAQAQSIMLNNVWPLLHPMLTSTK